MKIRVFPGYDEMCGAAADFIIARVTRRPSGLLCFPSGDTPTGILDRLVEASRAGRVDFSGCRFVGLDEWTGLNGQDEGSCRHYLDERFYLPLRIGQDRIHFFDGAAYDLQRECERINGFLREHGPVDLAMVGVGENGHVGLNEPGTGMEQYAHVSELQDHTRKVAEKYFQEKVTLSRGITLGPKNLLESRTLVMIASGQKKAQVMARALQEPVTPECPAGLIRLHADGHVFLDREAAARLSPL